MNRHTLTQRALGAVGPFVVAAMVVALTSACGDSDEAGSSADPSDETSTTTPGAATDPEGWHGGLVTDPLPRPDFTLTDTQGRPYDFKEKTAGRLTLLFFGYTSCPDICPIHMATLASALENPDVPDPTVVFVTTDPERDTPERLREWLDNFDPDFVGLTGTLEEIHQAEQATGVDLSFFTEGDGETPVSTLPSDGGYEVGHAAQIIAYTPDDLTHIVYPFGVQRDHWVADLPRLAEGWQPQPTDDGTPPPDTEPASGES